MIKILLKQNLIYADDDDWKFEGEFGMHDIKIDPEVAETRLKVRIRDLIPKAPRKMRRISSPYQLRGRTR